MPSDSPILARFVPSRRPFDPTNPEDVAEFKFFRENGRWKISCPFLLEEPYLDIPSMCKDRFINHTLN